MKKIFFIIFGIVVFSSPAFAHAATYFNIGSYPVNASATVQSGDYAIIVPLGQPLQNSTGVLPYVQYDVEHQNDASSGNTCLAMYENNTNTPVGMSNGQALYINGDPLLGVNTSTLASITPLTFDTSKYYFLQFYDCTGTPTNGLSFGVGAGGSYTSLGSGVAINSATPWFCAGDLESDCPAVSVTPTANIVFPDQDSVVPNFSNWYVEVQNINDPNSLVTGVGVIYQVGTSTVWRDTLAINSTYGSSTVDFKIAKNSLLSLYASTTVQAMPYMIVNGSMVYGNAETFIINPNLTGSLDQQTFNGSTTVATSTYVNAGPFFGSAPSTRVPVSGNDMQQTCVIPSDWSGYLTYAICYGWNLVTSWGSTAAQNTTAVVYNTAKGVFPFSVPLTLYSEVTEVASTTLATTTAQNIEVTLWNCVPMCVATSSRTLVIVSSAWTMPYIGDSWFLLQQYLFDVLLIIIIFTTVRHHA